MFDASVELPVEEAIVWVATAYANERVGCLWRKQAGKEVEVVGSIEVDFFVK